MEEEEKKSLFFESLVLGIFSGFGAISFAVWFGISTIKILSNINWPYLSSFMIYIMAASFILGIVFIGFLCSMVRKKAFITASIMTFIIFFAAFIFLWRNLVINIILT